MILERRVFRLFACSVTSFSREEECDTGEWEGGEEEKGDREEDREQEREENKRRESRSKDEGGMGS